MNFQFKKCAVIDTGYLTLFVSVGSNLDKVSISADINSNNNNKILASNYVVSTICERFSTHTYC